MGGCSRNAFLRSISVLALVAGGTVGVADTLGSGLTGAWTTSATDCARIFQRKGGVLSYRQPVDNFAQAAIIEPQQLLAPDSACRILAVAHVKDALSLTLECKDSVSFLTQTIEIKVRSNTEIVFSPNADPALATTLVKCQL